MSTRVSFKTISELQTTVCEQVRARRLSLGLTQQGLATRSGVALPTLCKFERQGQISLVSFLKLVQVVGGLEEMIAGLELPQVQYSSIDEVLKAGQTKTLKRGRRN